jgi:hypothetical protein
MSFGWAYVGCDDIAITSMAGPSGSVLVRTGTFTVSGSDNYKLFHEAAGSQNHSLLLTGSLKVKGSANMTGDLTIGGNLVANSYSVVNTTITEIAQNGSTNLGNGHEDRHRITGSVIVAGTSTSTPTLYARSSNINMANPSQEGANPGWSVGVGTNSPTSHLSVSGTVAFGYVGVTGTTSDLSTSAIRGTIIGVSNNNAVSITMPTANNTPGRILVIKDEATSQPRTGATKITLTASSGTTIDGNSHYFILGSRAAISLYSNGANWFVF